MSLQKNLAENFDYDILVCLNQCLAPLDRPSGRTFCVDCVRSIKWFTYDNVYCPPYMLWSWEDMFGGAWYPMKPNHVKSAYKAWTPEFNLQCFVLHPIQQVKFFLTEAIAKFNQNWNLLGQDWGSEAYEKIDNSFKDAMELVWCLEKIWWTDKQVDVKTMVKLLPDNAIHAKGRNIQRCLFLKVKKLIKDFESVLNKGTGPCFDFMRASHLSIPNESPGSVKHCKNHHLVKLD